jgi:tetraacyldisaccharide 4'-kinase
VDLVVHHGLGGEMELEPGELRHLRSGREERLALWAGRRVHAVAGIGRPERFFETLRRAGLDVVEQAFPDHYAFTAADIAFGDGLPVIMTEKDAVKCRAFADEEHWCLPVAARVSPAVADVIRKKLKR